MHASAVHASMTSIDALLLMWHDVSNSIFLNVLQYTAHIHPQYTTARTHPWQAASAGCLVLSLSTRLTPDSRDRLQAGQAHLKGLHA